jgi:acyl-CoA thioester hydrolase
MSVEKRRMVVERDIYVRAYDVDAMGIVSNIVYVRWFEDMRHAFLDVYYPYTEMMQEGKSPILIKTEVEYKTPVTLYNRPVARAWMEEVGGSKWMMGFEIFSGNVMHCKGWQTGCFYDVVRKRPIPLPERLRTQYEDEA